jgi:tetratricopeptide (TPR) repeat protein
MKRLLYVFIAAALLSAGCKKFLEEQSQDEVRPSTVQNLNSIMSADGYPYSSTTNPSNRLTLVVNMISDDVQCYGGQGQKDYELTARKGKAPFSWSKQMFEELMLPDGLSNKSQVNSWAIIYKRIAGCNVVLSYCDKVSGPQGEKENLRGQALAMRGYYYFMLVNQFARPYNDPTSTPETSPGVPLKLTMEVSDDFAARNTVAEVYSQIEADLKQAADLMKTYSATLSSPYKMNVAAAYTLLSRVYLYQEKWDLAIEYANKGLAIKPTLSQLSSFVADGGYFLYNNAFTSGGAYLNRIYDITRSKEVLWTYRPIDGGTLEWFKPSAEPNYSSTYKPVFCPSSALMALYDTRPLADNAVYIADLRPRLYFEYSAYFNPDFSFGFANVNGGMGGAGIRVAELYLNRAESNIHKFISTGNDALRQAALNDINTLRASRYDTRKPYVAVDIVDGNALLNFYKEERRREFPFEEGHRWFDLRRYGMPSFSHEYAETAGTAQIFTLTKGDSRYTLPIPLEVLQRNGELTQNP